MVNSTSNCSKNAMFGSNTSLILAATYSVIGLPGNILVIILILRAKEKKSTTTCQLLNLAIADIAFLLGRAIATIAAYLTVQCRIKKRKLLLLTIAPKIVANIILAMIALERYNALVKTMKPLLNITRKKILCSVMIAWITALLLCLPPTFLGIPKSVFAPLIITFGYLIPLVIVIFCYSSILKGLYFDRKILAEKVTDEARLREKKCLVRGLVVITLVFLACNLPKIVIIYGLNYDIQNRSSRRIAFVTLECLSSSINPYLYALHSENYRSQVKQLFCRKKGEENVKLSPAVFDNKL